MAASNSSSLAQPNPRLLCSLVHKFRGAGTDADDETATADFLNDLQMMDEATYSFAMANAHPALKERARYLSPGNTDNGVVRTIKAVLGLGGV